MRTQGSRALLTVLALASWGLAACSDTPAAPITATVPSAQGPLLDNLIVQDANGVEYQFDTGEVACPAILNSNVKYWVSINGVGQRLFTFFAPHVRMTYLGRGVYRYRMTIGVSDDDQWMAEGPWTGRCIGYAQWGIGKVLSFDGTVWRVIDDDSGGGECGDREEYNMYSYDPYSPDESEFTTECSSGGGNSVELNCWWESITIEISYDGGLTWQPWWSGLARVCEEASE